MQTPKGRGGSSEVPQKISPRAVRRLRPSSLDTDSTSSTNPVRTPKEKSTKVAERRSPNSPVTEKKRPSKISELESQVSHLQEELKKAKDQLVVSESCRNKALEDAEESKKQLSSVSSQLEDLQKQLLEFSSEKPCVVELQNLTQEKDQAWQSGVEVVLEQHSVDSVALVSAASEIQQLKVQLEMVAEFEDAQSKQAESTDAELQTLKANLIETLSLVENMRNQLTDSKESEAHAQALANETLVQLETARRTVEALRFDSMKAIVAYNSIGSELEQSRERVNLLEQLVSKFEAEKNDANINHSPNSENRYDTEQINSGERSLLEAELSSLKSEVEQLKCALEAAERKYQDEQENSNAKLQNANELVEQLKSVSSQLEAELDAELKHAKADIEQLKADLMDKETELQGITEENEGLSMKLQKSFSSHKESDMESELRKLKESVANLKSNLMDKETELQNISEENELLKLKISKRETTRGKANNEIVEVETASTAEREALVKLGLALEEADKSNKKVARVTEQLEAAQAAIAETEAELRRLKVQSDQWRKAAEAAASILSAGNNIGKFMERTGSMDNAYNPMVGNIGSLCNDDMEDDLKKKNGNMLKKIGVLWKKTPQK